MIYSSGDLESLMTVSSYSYGADSGATWDVFQEKDLTEATECAVAHFFGDGAFSVDKSPKEKMCVSVFYSGGWYEVIFPPEGKFLVSKKE